MERYPPSALKILFISHDSSSTGAPHSLLNFLQCLRAVPEVEFRIVVLKGGDLVTTYGDLAPTLVLRKDHSIPATIIERILNRLKIRIALPRQPVKWVPLPAEQELLDEFLADFQPSLIYVNSVAAAPIFAYLKPTAPVITYVRELQKFVQYTVGTGWFGELINRTSQYIAVSKASQNYLVDNYGIKPERFTVIPPFIDIAKLKRFPRSEARMQLCGLASRSDCSFIVVACGTTDWRKGPDLFVAIAERFYSDQPGSDAVFIWIGGMDDQKETNNINRAIERAKLTDRVFFPGIKPNSASMIGAADVFAMTSREEPFGRVMLEAGIADIPTVCFKKSGGAQEFVEKGAGIAVDYEDAEAFSKAIQSLLKDENLRIKLGKRAHEIVIKDHDPLVSSQLILSKIREVVNTSAAKRELGSIKQ